MNDVTLMWVIGGLIVVGLVAVGIISYFRDMVVPRPAKDDEE